MTDIRNIRIFISSPGDVAEERENAKQVIAELQRHYEDLEDYEGQLKLIPVMWEDLAIPATASFQEGIELILSEQHPIDIAVFILWSKFGSPLGPAIRKRDGSAYSSGTEHEFDLMLTAFEQSGGVRPHIMAYTREEDRAGFNDRLDARSHGEDELAEILRQKKLVRRFITEHFQDEHGHNQRAIYSYPNPISFARQVKGHLRQRLDYLLNLESTAAKWAGNPYRELAFFDVDHAAVFYGRDKEVNDLRERLRQQEGAGCAFACIVGASGAGKSSLARAGVAADLLNLPYLSGVKEGRAAIFLPSLARDEGLLPKLAQDIAKQLPELAKGAGGVERFVQRLQEGNHDAASDLLETAIQQVRKQLKGPFRLLVVIDQMEELWTEGIGKEHIEIFFSCLEALARIDGIHVLATLRSDFYPKVQPFKAFVRMKGTRGHFDLLPPEPAALRDIILKPARKAGLRFERDELTGLTLDKKVLKDASKDPSALPLLQYALGQLYVHAREGKEDVLTFQAYKKIGKLEGALSTKITELFEGLSQGVTKALDELLPLLISVENATDQPSRRRAPITSLTSTEDRKTLTEALISARLLVTDNDKNTADRDGTPVAAFAHEALLRRWKRLADWITNNRKDLCTATGIRNDAKLWQEHAHDSSYLYPEGLQLHEAVSLLPGTFLEAAERAFVEASVKAVAEQSFRRSLASGKGMHQCSHRLLAEHPEVRLKVIGGLLYSTVEEERRNTAMLLGECPASEFPEELVRLVVSDPSESVRRAAAWSLMHRDDTAPCEEIAKRAEQAVGDPTFLTALAHLLVAADMQVYAPHFDQWFLTLSSRLRLRVRVQSWLLRLKMAVPVFLAVVIPAIALSVASAMAFKWLPGMFNYAYGQADPSAVMSLFHAATAAILIGGSAAFGLSLYRMVFGREHGSFHYLRPLGSVGSGAIFGALGGILCTAAIAGVFLPEGLRVMGWLKENEYNKPSFLDFCHKLFIENRCGLVFTLNGMGVGIGMALMTNRLRGCPDWDAYLQVQSASKLSDFDQVFKVIRDLTRLAFTYCWPIPAALLATSAIGIALLASVPMGKPPKNWHDVMLGGVEQAQKNHSSSIVLDGSIAGDQEYLKAQKERDEQRLKLREWKTSLAGRILGVAGDSTAKVIGAFFAVVGMGFGIVILRSGINVEARRRVG